MIKLFSKTRIVKLISLLALVLLVSAAYLYYRHYQSQKTVALPVSSQTNLPTANAASHLSWIIQYHFLSLIQQNSAASNEFARANKIYVILSKKEAASGIAAKPVFNNLVLTDYFNSYSQFVADYNNHQINPAVKAVLFDDSSDTPASVVPTVEANNPYQYDQLFSNFAHQHGMVSMCDYILGKRIHAKQGLAPPCDIAVLNYSQQSERDASKYSQVVSSAVAVIHATNPNMPVLVGISTNPRGPVINPSQIVASVAATYKSVSGYWISVPTSGGIGCPNCSPQNPAILPVFLQDLFEQSIY